MAMGCWAWPHGPPPTCPKFTFHPCACTQTENSKPNTCGVCFYTLVETCGQISPLAKLKSIVRRVSILSPGPVVSSMHTPQTRRGTPLERRMSRGSHGVREVLVRLFSVIARPHSSRGPSLVAGRVRKPICQAVALPLAPEGPGWLGWLCPPGVYSKENLKTRLRG